MLSEFCRQQLNSGEFLQEPGGGACSDPGKQEVIDQLRADLAAAVSAGDEAKKDGGAAAEAGAKEIHRGWWGIYTTGFITYYLPPLLWL